MEELPKRLRILDNRGSDNPHLVGMAPVEGNIIVVVGYSASRAIPGMVRRVEGGGYGWGPLPRSTEARTRNQMWTLKGVCRRS